ncbi:MAG: hypothetical protein GX638_00330 [Crenarchaeota archaeon]|nr:hypothetical protein [Thermoproteota archaeon]
MANLVLGCKVSIDVYDEFKKVAKKQRRKVSNVLQIIIEDYLENERKKEKE